MNRILLPSGSHFFLYLFMIIGLVRHFKVDAPIYKHPLTSDEFNKTQHYYDSADVIKHDVDLGTTDWQICYASTLKRARETAEHIYKNEIVYTDLIVEVDAASIKKSNKKKSFAFWAIAARLAWLFGHKSQKESKKQTKRRCEKFYNELKLSGKENILVVSHGFFIREFASFLKKNGYEGKLEFSPKNATLYVFTNDHKLV